MENADADREALASPRGHFTILQDKAMPCYLACMCPTMDLVATVHADGQLSVYRTISWQRSFTLSLEDLGNRTFSCASWSPDGKTLAVGYTDGTLQLLGVETGTEECSLNFHEGQSLVALTWVAQQRREDKNYTQIDHEADQLSELMDAYTDRCEHLLGPSDILSKGAFGGGGGSSAANEASQAEDGFSLLKGMKERPVSVLASADASGLVVLSVCGVYRLITIDLEEHRRPSDKKGNGKASDVNIYSPLQSRRSQQGQRLGGPGSAGNEVKRENQGVRRVRPLQLTLSADLGLLSALVEVEDSIELIQVDLPLLWSQRHELKPLAVQYTAFQALLKRLAAFVPRLPSLWQNTLRPLESKLIALEELLSSYGYHEDISTRDELLHLVTCGYASDALTQLFSNTLTEVQLVRMQKAMEAGTGQVESILRGNVSFLARTLLFRACDLPRLSLLCNTREGIDAVGGDGSGSGEVDMGLGAIPVQSLQLECEALCVKVEQTLREVQACRYRLRSLLAWLVAVVPAVTGAPSVPEGTVRPPPSLSLSMAVLAFLKEPLGSDHLGHPDPGSDGRKSRNDNSTPSRVENLIGSRVSGLTASTEENTGSGQRGLSVPKEACMILKDDAVLAARTMTDQAQRLTSAADNVFKAPQGRLSQAVGKFVFARVCGFRRGSVNNNRPATKGRLRVNMEQTPLVPLRVCMCYQDNISGGNVSGESGGEEEGGTSSTPGIVVAAVSEQGKGNQGSEGEVVWIMAVSSTGGERSPPESAGAKETAQVAVTGIRVSSGHVVRQVAFYDSVPGVSSQNTPRLALVLQPSEQVVNQSEGKKGGNVLHLLEFKELSYSTLGAIEGFQRPDNGMGGGSATIGAFDDIVRVAERECVEILSLSDIECRSRALTEHSLDLTVALSGARGMACAVSASRLMILDLEEDADEEGEDDEEE